MRPEEYANSELAEWRKAQVYKPETHSSVIDKLSQEIKSLQSVAIRPEDEEEHALKLRMMVQREEEKESNKDEKDKGRGEDVNKYLSHEEGAAIDKEKETVDLDIDIVDNPTLSAPVTLPIPLPLPVNTAPPLTAVPSSIASVISAAPIWKGVFDKVATDVESFNAKAYHVGGPHVDTLLARVTSFITRGKAEMPKLEEYLNKLDESPHRTRSLIVFEPESTDDESRYSSTWDFYRGARTQYAVLAHMPPTEDDETVARLDGVCDKIVDSYTSLIKFPL